VTQIHELASSYALGALDAEERDRFEVHLRQGCGECEAVLRSLSPVTDVLAEMVAAEPPPGLRSRILERAARPPRKPGILLQDGGLLISRSDDMPWRPMADGIVFKTLFRDPARRYTTMLVRMDAGARYPDHRHQDVEELFLLSGDLHVAGEVMRPGDYCRGDVNSHHGVTFSETGCMILLLASQDNVMLP